MRALPSQALGAPEMVHLRKHLHEFLEPFEFSVGAPPPAGRWLRDDLLHLVRQNASESQRATARRLGLPEPTLRKQLRAAGRRDHVRPANWEPVLDAFDDWARTLDGSFRAPDALRLNCLLVADPLFGTARQVCSACGLTERTGRVWLARLEREPAIEFRRSPRRPGPIPRRSPERQKA